MHKKEGPCCDEIFPAMPGGRLRELGYHDVWKFCEHHVILISGDGDCIKMRSGCPGMAKRN